MSVRNRTGAPAPRRGVVTGVVCALILSAQTIPAAGAANPPPTTKTARGTLPATADRLSADEASAKAAGNGPSAAAAWATFATTALRESARRVDPGLLGVAEAALVRAERLDKRLGVVRQARAELALAKHDFSRARVLAESLLSDDPANEAGRIVLADALIELGQLEQAATVLEAVASTRPSPAVLARVSYLRELTGDLRGALSAMTTAEEQARFDTAAQPTFSTLLGDLHLVRGDVRSADAAYLRALSSDPTNPLAQFGRARVAVAIGRDRDALAMLDRLIDRVPLPSAAALAAEVSHRSGRPTDADRYDAVVRATLALFVANGSTADVELALLEADRGDARLAVKLAQEARAERSTSGTADALAWALFRSGKASAAVPHSEQAIATGNVDPMVRAHTALVFDGVGDAARTRVQLRMISGRTAALNPSLLMAVQAAAEKHSVVLAPAPTHPTFRS